MGELHDAIQFSYTNLSFDFFNHLDIFNFPADILLYNF